MHFDSSIRTGYFVLYERSASHNLRMIDCFDLVTICPDTFDNATALTSLVSGSSMTE